jgi:hypothetical protein
LKLSFNEIDSIRVEIKEGINPSRSIFLKLTDKSQIPLTSSQIIMSISDLEKKATQLAEIFQVPVEGLY